MNNKSIWTDFTDVKKLSRSIILIDNRLLIDIKRSRDFTKANANGYMYYMNDNERKIYIITKRHRVLRDGFSYNIPICIGNGVDEVLDYLLNNNYKKELINLQKELLFKGN